MKFITLIFLALMMTSCNVHWRCSLDLEPEHAVPQEEFQMAHVDDEKDGIDVIDIPFSS